MEIANLHAVFVNGCVGQWAAGVSTFEFYGAYILEELEKQTSGTKLEVAEAKIARLEAVRDSLKIASLADPLELLDQINKGVPLGTDFDLQSAEEHCKRTLPEPSLEQLDQTNYDIKAPPVIEDETSAKTEASFDVIITSVPDDKQISVFKAIDEVKKVGLAETMTLGKALVEGRPMLLLSGVSKTDANNVKYKLESAGASVEIIRDSGFREVLQNTNLQACKEVKAKIEAKRQDEEPRKNVAGIWVFRILGPLGLLGGIGMLSDAITGSAQQPYDPGVGGSIATLFLCAGLTAWAWGFLPQKKAKPSKTKEVGSH